MTNPRRIRIPRPASGTVEALALAIVEAQGLGPGEVAELVLEHAADCPLILTGAGCRCEPLTIAVVGSVRGAA